LFGASKIAPPPVLWYQKNFPPFLDFDQDGSYAPYVLHMHPTDCSYAPLFSTHLRRYWQAFHVREG
jgi:hypothetical protein